MENDEKVLILCVDRDNDLFEKAKIEAPVIGKEACLNAATELLLHDPEDSDGNTIFAALKLRDELKDSEIIILAGDRRLGYVADKKISEQLEEVLKRIPAHHCVLVSDGESDELILPVIQSRVKVDSVKRVIMKQGKELEKTYVVLLEKLKEPHYARIIFGIPGLLVLLYAAGEMLGLSWLPMGVAAGLYLMAKAFGLEEKFLDFVNSFKFSIEKISSIGYLVALFLLIVGIWTSFDSYSTLVQQDPYMVEVVARVVMQFLNVAFWAVVFAILGKVVEAYQENRLHKLPKYFLYLANTLVIIFLMQKASQWVLREAFFSEFFYTIIAGIGIVILSMELARFIKTYLVAKLNLNNREVLSSAGAYIGKVIGTDSKKDAIVILTPFGEKLQLNINKIADVGEKVVLF